MEKRRERPRLAPTAWRGEVVSLYIAPTAAGRVQGIPEVRALEDQGLEDDRYCKHIGTFSNRPGPQRQVTLIEIEALEGLERDYAIELDPGESRRNIVTRGVPLNHLVGREFCVGEAKLRGIKLCEPCSHLEKLTLRGVERGLKHRGGLRAQVVTGGTIRVGDIVEAAKSLVEAGAAASSD